MKSHQRAFPVIGMVLYALGAGSLRAQEGGPAPGAPFPGVGEDPTADALDCAR